MKKLLIVILLVFFCGNAYAGMLIGSGSSGVATCDTSTVNATGSSWVGTGVVGLTTNAFGQAFQIDAGRISKISLDTFVSTGGEVTVRWGATKDLNTYIAEKTLTVSSSAKTTFIFDTKGTVSASTTYYLGVMEESGVDVRVYRDVGGDIYPNGNWVGISSGWQLGSDTLIDNLKFEIELCD